MERGRAGGGISDRHGLICFAPALWNGDEVRPSLAAGEQAGSVVLDHPYYGRRWLAAKLPGGEWQAVKES